MARPDPRLIRSFEDAALSAAEWLRYYGFHDAATTGSGSDGGVDVRGGRVVAQVKAEVGRVGRPVIQQIFGVASHESKQAAVFALGGFTRDAVEWADSTGVALFTLDLSGEPGAVNQTASEMAAAGGEWTVEDLEVPSNSSDRRAWLAEADNADEWTRRVLKMIESSSSGKKQKSKPWWW